jgi:hypothetical protein
MISGNPTWNQRVAAMAAQSRPLYTFEIPDEGLIISSFDPEESDIALDYATLLANDPLWAQAVLNAAALKSISLPAVQGFAQLAADGSLIVAPPSASVTRFNFGPSIVGSAAYLGWKGALLPPGAPDLKKALSISLVLLSSMGAGSYVPYGEIDYSVLGSKPYLTTPGAGWFQALHSNTPGWTNLTTTVQLWPGNSDVGPDIPDLDAIEIRIAQDGATEGSVPDGITFSVSASLLIRFP